MDTVGALSVIFLAAVDHVVTDATILRVIAGMAIAATGGWLIGTRLPD